MDLIYMNNNREDVGVLHDYSFDLAFGSDENDFQLKVDRKNHCCNAGYMLYIEGTEYGGVIDDIRSVKKSESVIYSGRTWHGILSNKVLCPDDGEDYLICNGEANSVLATLISRMNLSDMFEASTEASGITIDNYKMHRYIKAYDGILKMLKSASGKLMFTFSNGKVILSAEAIVDYSQDEQFDDDQVETDIKKYYRPINHVICLGGGNLSEREVIHLYADSNGCISHTQSLTGIDEVTAVYDYPSVESSEELEAGGREIIEEAYSEGIVKLNFDSESKTYDIGDIVGSKDVVTGIAATCSITKKIISIDKGKISIQYKVGE